MPLPFVRYKDLLRQYLGPHMSRVAGLTVLLLINTGLQLLNPQILRHFIDTAQGEGPLATLKWAALLFIVVALITQVIAVAARYASEKLGWLATNALREDLAQHCLELEMGFHNRRSPGELIERIDGDVASLANFFSQFIIRILGSLLLLIGILGVLYLEDWRLGTVLSLYAIGAIWGLMKLRHLAVPYWKEARQASAEMYGFIEEQLNGTEDIRANGGTAFTMNSFFGHAKNRLFLERRAGVMSVWMRVAMRGFRTLGLLLALGVGYYLFNEGALTVGAVFMVITYANNLFRPLEQLTREMEDLQQASAAIERIDELYHTEKKLADGPGVEFPSGPQAVEFDRVSFAYGDELVLNQLSFRLEPGQVLGLLGHTGSGKTTISRLLFRLFDVGEGQVRLGGEDVRQAQLHQLRRRVGMVTQNVQLFHATLRQNLTFFDETISDQRINSALEAVDMLAWCQALPKGLDTGLEGGGKGLSAGEAQLLTFARVFLRDPGLVILDEASSRLDPATEGRIEMAVERLLANRTGIIIAHRLATVQRADHILILEAGRLREWGGRQALQQDPNSRFAQLLRAGAQELVL